MTKQSPATAALAERAREEQQWAPVHSLPRKAWGVVAVALDGARTVDSARRRLYAHRIPREVRTAAVQLLAELADPTSEGDQQP